MKTHLLLSLAILVAFGAPLLIPSSTALAEQKVKTVFVSAKSRWTSTGLKVSPGANVRLFASGEIHGAPFSDLREYYHNVPPEGHSPLRHFPYPQLPGLGLLARVGSAAPIAVGSKCELAVRGRGEQDLLLGINDDICEDNDSGWYVRIIVSDKPFDDLLDAAAGGSFEEPPMERDAVGP
jgi:hypothetical protein